MPVSSKVIASTSGAFGGGGNAVVVIWLLGLFHIPVSAEVAAVLAGWCATGGAYFFGWLVRETNLTFPPQPIQQQAAGIPPGPAVAPPPPSPPAQPQGTTP